MATSATAAPPPGRAPPRPVARPPDFVAELVARSFFRALRDGDGETLAATCALPFSLDGEVVAAQDALRARWADLRGRVPAPRRIVVLALAEAVARYGPPPARLAPLVVPGAAVALARFPRGGMIAILHKRGDRWKVVGLSD